MLQADCEMFLKVMKGRGSEFGSLGDRIVLIFLFWIGFFPFFLFLRCLGSNLRLIFGKKLIKVHAGITTLKIG